LSFPSAFKIHFLIGAFSGDDIVARSRLPEDDRATKSGDKSR
jgi:hypothetical protein